MHADFDLDLLRLLVAAVDRGSHAGAARALGVSRATVRRRLAELEAQVGAALLHRRGDGLQPTAAGEALARGARSLLTEAHALMAQAASANTEPEGLVRVAMPPGEPPFLGVVALAAIRARWPRVSLEIINAPWPERLISEHADMALSFAEPAPEGPWSAVHLLDAEQRLVASPSYLRRRGTPTSLADLAAHDLLCWRGTGEGPLGLTLRRGGVVPLPAPPVFVSNSIHTLRDMTIAGSGIGWFPDGGFPAPTDPPNALQPVLADLVGASRSMRLLLPNAYRDIPRARALADALVAVVHSLRLGR